MGIGTKALVIESRCGPDGGRELDLLTAKAGLSVEPLRFEGTGFPQSDLAVVAY